MGVCERAAVSGLRDLAQRADTHRCLSCLPLLLCSLNSNNMWACVGSVTHKDHGRMPGIDAPGRHGGVDDSHSQSEGKRGHACACVLRRIQKSQKLHNTCIIYVALAVMSWSFPCFYRCTERVFFLLVVASGHVATLGG